MKKTIRENLHLAFKTDDNIDTDVVDDLSNIDLDEIINVVRDYMQSKNDNDSELSDLDDTDEFNFDDLDDLDDSEFDLNGTPNLDDTDSDTFDDIEDIDDADFDSLSDTTDFDSLDDTGDYDDEFDFNLDDTGEFGDLDNDPEFELDDEVDLGDDTDENDFQGDIRTVKGAKLVYKRKTEDGTFEELWIYNVGKDMKAETGIRRAILAGTDINPSTNQSDEGEQSADAATVGNVQFLHITGLTN